MIHIQHTSDNPDSVFHPANEGHLFKDMANPLEEETVIQKKVNSSFIGTNLEEHLRSNQIDTVVIAGLTTPHCVSTTTRMSGNLGFDTYLISDATAAFGLTDQNGTYFDPETIHRLSLATLHDEFATVMTTEQLIAKWTSQNERLKAPRKKSRSFFHAKYMCPAIVFVVSYVSKRDQSQ